MDSGLSDKKCAICGNTFNNHILSVKEMVLGTREIFSYLHCGQCKTLSLIDFPVDIGKYYQDYYSLSESKNNINTFMAWLKNFVDNNIIKKCLIRYMLTHKNILSKWLLSFDFYTLYSHYIKFDNVIILRELLGFFTKLLGFTPDIRSLAVIGCKLDYAILDVGCGDGKLISLLSDLGFSNVLGCDPYIQQEIVFKNGNKIIKDYLENISGQFDIIMFHHSFEHMPDPLEVIKKASQLLKPEGIIILRFPNIDSIEYRKFKENWWGIHAPRHYFLFSLEGLKIVLGAARLFVCDYYCDSGFDHYLYSTEYALDIDDKSPLSFRNKKRGLWLSSELSFCAEKAKIYNKNLVGDWICYYAGHKNDNN